MGERNRLAVFFPGMGYHEDKPLLYYSKKLAVFYGYEILQISYGDVIRRAGGDTQEERKNIAFSTAKEVAEDFLGHVRWEEYEKLLFVSKSIGTVVAADYANRHHLTPDHILFTPVEETFRLLDGSGTEADRMEAGEREAGAQKRIVFHGTEDPLIKTAAVRAACRERGIPLCIVEQGNHSLETGRVVRDLERMITVMQRVERFLQEDI